MRDQKPLLQGGQQREPEELIAPAIIATACMLAVIAIAIVSAIGA